MHVNIICMNMKINKTHLDITENHLKYNLTTSQNSSSRRQNITSFLAVTSPNFKPGKSYTWYR